ncbi:MAG TPA: hypothetical protein VFA60_09240 [Terriglobales bacterium]|nr:hypothetical protein [Terriglobales bacterium]
MHGALIVVAQYRDLPEALLAKGKLESAGIECTMTDDNIVRMDWFWPTPLAA